MRRGGAPRLGFGLLAIAILGTLASPRCACGDRLPDWAREAAARPTPAWAASEPAVVLYDAERVEAAGAGRIISTRQVAVRVLGPRGAAAAMCAAGYIRGVSQIRSLHAWQLDTAGTHREWSRSDAVEASLTPRYDLYGDARTLLLAPEHAPPGSVFAWESREESIALLGQWRWPLRGRFPTLRSRFEIDLPAGVSPRAKVFGAVIPAIDSAGGRGSWTVSDQRALPEEPMESALWSARPTLALEVPSGALLNFGAAFADWDSVSRWLFALASDQDEVTPAIRARVGALTAGDADTLRVIRALSLEAQRLNYVHVQLGLGKGWGYRPNPADEVLDKGYGDCKDKANLLRALLKAAGFRSWLLTVDSDGPDAIEQGFPSPTQFDHCILAVQVPPGTNLPASFDGAGRGRLLAFDPTDRMTPFGQLPAHEQGALGLLVSREHDALVRLPQPRAGADGISRRLEGTLADDGTLSCRLRERSTGPSATDQRRSRRRLSESQYRSELAGWLLGDGATVELKSYSLTEDSASGGAELQAEFQVPRFARVVQGRILTLYPEIVGVKMASPFPEPLRALPIRLDNETVDLEVTLEMPAGFRAEEIPEPVELRFDFGSLSAKWSVTGTTVGYVRRWRTLPVTLPPDRYAEVRSLFGACRDARRASIVFVR